MPDFSPGSSTTEPERTFPLQGIIGVVSSHAGEIDLAIRTGIHCVEIRSDLLLQAGLSVDDLITLTKQAKENGLGTLFTLRHPDHGGVFSGSEQQRIDINRLALNAGADMIDLEWQTPAAQALLADNAPVIYSYHDFDGMLSRTELAELTGAMEKASPRAIKVVPTASGLEDSVRMLQWVGEGTGSFIRRIGFAMGEAGACSRILTTSFGAPITYASFGAPVAPGQVDINDLQKVYRVPSLNAQTQLVAVTGPSDQVNSKIVELNQQFELARENKVAIGFAPETDLKTHQQELRIAEF